MNLRIVIGIALIALSVTGFYLFYDYTGNIRNAEWVPYRSVVITGAGIYLIYTGIKRKKTP